MTMDRSRAYYNNYVQNSLAAQLEYPPTMPEYEGMDPIQAVAKWIGIEAYKMPGLVDGSFKANELSNDEMKLVVDFIWEKEENRNAAIKGLTSREFVR